MKTTTIARATALSLGILMLAGCGDKDQANSTPPPPSVGVVAVQSEAVPLTRDLVGRLSSYRQADVRARVSGVILERTYTEGKEVKKGDLLFKIDPAPYQAALDGANAQLAQAQASYTNAKVNADRARKLEPKGYVSDVDLNNAEAAERTTKAAVQVAQANVTAAKINLGYTQVTSPIDGRAGEQQVTEGALVGQGAATLLTTVEQLDPLYVNFTMSADELNQLQIAQHQGKLALSEANKTTVSVSLSDGSLYDKQGTLDFSSPSVNPTTGSVNLRAVIPNPDGMLKPGTYVNVLINLGERSQAIVLPQEAVQRDIKGPFVFVVNDENIVNRKDIVTAGMHNAKFVVTGGVESGDQVIVSGIQRAVPGNPVTPETESTTTDE